MWESQRATEGQIVRAMPEGVAISVHVQPRASRTESAGIHGQALKIRVAAPPADGAANDELCRFLARHCEVPLSAIQILSGAGSRQKRVLVKGRSVEQVRARFQLEAEGDR
ncbi:MAG: YggU family protein [Nitrospira defluvii]|nr:YggU family protein [Nitrospira defluvii]